MSAEASGGEPCGAIEVVAKERILTVTLANPPDNRLTSGMVEGLAQALDQFESDGLDVLVITGSKRVFSKGFDVDAMKSRDTSDLRPLLVLSNAIFTRIARSPKLTLAAISGTCLGGGLELAMACHLRVCAEKSRLGLPEVWLNLIPGLGGVYRLSRLVGAAKALELVALGDLLTAEEALRLNIVSRVFPQADFAERVALFVSALTAANQKVIREVLRLAACSGSRGEEENIRQTTESFIELWSCLPKT
ncbi:MAG: fadB [candidate division NC10 bacterium]|nr:fadB [candidate division NC10 bacterium]MBM2812650.1 fadB [Chloroflexota bacterium]